ncbi:hypothetical protein BASA60_007550 [Batrachochytrium salamandrivorans]|nr:hypothetical protein BASA60_007550 [Batrachochytrium salamandrivorans]
MKDDGDQPDPTAQLFSSPSDRADHQRSQQARALAPTVTHQASPFLPLHKLCVATFLLVPSRFGGGLFATTASSIPGASRTTDTTSTSSTTVPITTTGNNNNTTTGNNNNTTTGNNNNTTTTTAASIDSTTGITAPPLFPPTFPITEAETSAAVIVSLATTAPHQLKRKRSQSCVAASETEALSSAPTQPQQQPQQPQQLQQLEQPLLVAAVVSKSICQTAITPATASSPSQSNALCHMLTTTAQNSLGCSNNNNSNNNNSSNNNPSSSNHTSRRSCNTCDSNCTTGLAHCSIAHSLQHPCALHGLDITVPSTPSSDSTSLQMLRSESSSGTMGGNGGISTSSSSTPAGTRPGIVPQHTPIHVPSQSIPAAMTAPSAPTSECVSSTAGHGIQATDVPPPMMEATTTTTHYHHSIDSVTPVHSAKRKAPVLATHSTSSAHVSSLLSSKGSCSKGGATAVAAAVAASDCCNHHYITTTTTTTTTNNNSNNNNSSGSSSSSSYACPLPLGGDAIPTTNTSATPITTATTATTVVTAAAAAISIGGISAIPLYAHRLPNTASHTTPLTPYPDPTSVDLQHQPTDDDMGMNLSTTAGSIGGVGMASNPASSGMGTDIGSNLHHHHHHHHHHHGHMGGAAAVAAGMGNANNTGSSSSNASVGSLLTDICSPTLPSPTMSPTVQYSHISSPSHAYLHQQQQQQPSAWSSDSHPLGQRIGHCDTVDPMGSISTSGQSRNAPTLADLPMMISTFDSLPTPMKNYVMTQLLKRCPFSSLQFVSSLILPSLKRDYIALVPVELSYQIIGYLDLKTLGRCQRVSRAWRRVVDGEGAELSVWKRRLVSEGFADESEITQAYIHRALSSASPTVAGDRHAFGRNSNNYPFTHSGGDHATYLDAKTNPTATTRPSLSTSFHNHQQGLIAENNHGPPRPVYRHLYKRLYKRHHLIRRNWLLGRYRHISFPGHGPNVVTCLQFDTEKIVSGSDDQTIHVYNTADGTLLKRLEGHEGGVWALQYWKDTLVSGSTDRSVRVWDIESGECSHIFDGHTSTVRCLMIIIPQKNDATDDGIAALDQPVIVTGSRDATLRVWRLPDPRRDAQWSPAIAAMRTAQYHQEVAAGIRAPAGALTPGRDTANQVERGGPPDVTNPFFMHVLLGHSNSVRAIAGQGNVLISGSYDCTIRVWDITKGECVHVFRGHREKVYSVGYCHELRRAVSGSMDATVKVWCTRTGVALFNLEGHTSLVGLLELSPDYLVSAAADATLRVWSPVTGQCLSNLTGHSAAITCFHHDAKYNRIVSGSDGGIKIWELSSVGYGTHTGLMSANSNGVIPADCPLGGQLAFTQGPNGAEPVYGRFLRDVIGGVQGVWRVRTDETRLVCAVQREEGGTWFEVLDFDVDGDGPSGGGGGHGGTYSTHTGMGVPSSSTARGVLDGDLDLMDSTTATTAITASTLDPSRVSSLVDIGASGLGMDGSRGGSGSYSRSGALSASSHPSHHPHYQHTGGSGQSSGGGDLHAPSASMSAQTIMFGPVNQ